jgi:hypothetical protein
LKQNHKPSPRMTCDGTATIRRDLPEQLCRQTDRNATTRSPNNAGTATWLKRDRCLIPASKLHAETVFSSRNDGFLRKMLPDAP